MKNIEVNVDSTEVNSYSGAGWLLKFNYILYGYKNKYNLEDWDIFGCDDFLEVFSIVLRGDGGYFDIKKRITKL